jgi:hypothetical protein
MKTNTTLLAAVLPALFSVGTSAQDASTKAAETFVMPAGETSVQDLVDHCATYLDINILTNPQECSHGQPIRLQKAITTNRSGCQDLLTGLLYRAGFALTTVDEDLGLYEVIMMTGTRGREIMNRAQHRTVDEVLARPNLKVVVTAVVELKHINAQLANNSLRPFFASTGGNNAGASLMIGTAGTASSLILSGMQDQVAQAIRMVKLCDVPQPENPMHSSPGQPSAIAKLEARVRSLEKQLAKLTKKSESK